MIISTGMRTDIPAFYSKWFMNRIREGYVCARNPYYPKLVTKYNLNSDYVDCIQFCTKNPYPMLKYLDELKQYNMLWYVTITPYGKDIEPNVWDKNTIIKSFQELAKKLPNSFVGWRYDPIFLNEDFTVERHIKELEKGLRLIRRQYPTISGPIDLLATDNKGRMVVIELKKNRVSDKVIGQVARYVSFLEREQDKEVRAIIIGKKIDNNIKLAVNALSCRTDLYNFDYRVNFERVN